MNACTHPNCETHGKSPTQGIGCDGRTTQERTTWQARHPTNPRADLDTAIADLIDEAKADVLEQFAAQAETEGAPDNVVTWLRYGALTYRGHIRQRHGLSILPLVDTRNG